MEIVKLPQPNLRDVPNGLRLLADLIEKGEAPKAKHAIVILTDTDNGKTFYSYGDSVTWEHVAGVMFTCAAIIAMSERS